MDILYLLIPLSVVLALLIVGALAWAIFGGQFEDLEREGGGFSRMIELCQIDHVHPMDNRLAY